MAVNLKSLLRKRAVDALILAIPKVESYEEAQHFRTVYKKGISNVFFTPDEILYIDELLFQYFEPKGW